MLHRIFIAINLPENIKSRISNIQEEWPTLPCRWVNRENLHITLAFLGNRNNQELEKVLEISKEIATASEPFLISFSKVCYGPGAKIPPRLVWIEGEKSQAFHQLKTNMGNLLSEGIGFWPDRKKSLPHITIARVKTWNWRQLEPDDRPDIDSQVSIEVPVNSIEVMKSYLKKTGPEYQILQTFKL